MMWFFRHFLIFISYHIFLLNQVEGAIAIPPSNSAPLPLFCPSVCPSVCPSIGLLTTFSGFSTFADKSLGRNGIELEMQMFPDDLPLANIDADGYCCHFMRSSAKEGGSHYWEMAVAITCGYGGYMLPLLAAHSSWIWITVECCYNVLQYNMMHTTLHSCMQWQNINQGLHSRKTPHNSPSLTLSCELLWWKLDEFIMAPHCTMEKVLVKLTSGHI